MGEAGFPLQFDDGFAGLAWLEGCDAWKDRGLVANWIVTEQDTWNGGETQRQKQPAPSMPFSHKRTAAKYRIIFVLILSEIILA
jgi:hypothetical protein